MKKIARLVYQGDLTSPLEFGIHHGFKSLEHEIINAYRVVASQGLEVTWFKRIVDIEISELSGEEIEEHFLSKSHRSDGQYVYCGQFCLRGELEEKIRHDYKKLTITLYDDAMEMKTWNEER